MQHTNQTLDAAPLAGSILASKIFEAEGNINRLFDLRDKLNDICGRLLNPRPQEIGAGVEPKAMADLPNQTIEGQLCTINSRLAALAADVDSIVQKLNRGV